MPSSTIYILGNAQSDCEGVLYMNQKLNMKLNAHLMVYLFCQTMDYLKIPIPVVIANISRWKDSWSLDSEHLI